tara:strand:+ start:2191 stop:2307 length:117 start_codon:yes stop_codon:yes gene_type:complete
MNKSLQIILLALASISLLAYVLAKWVLSGTEFGGVMDK